MPINAAALNACTVTSDRFAGTHGSPWRYDTFVPVIFAGAGIEPQKVYREIHTIDVAPTLAAVAGTKPPSGTRGEVLVEVRQGR